ncbi:ParA family protein [Methylobacterium sp. J-030]|uniref:ParA family protein n=1 Tax=Methylobacterium sp. J-030 TaxID=2836627 RepID=UPI001FBAAC49|nr:ParA family protein [Methylobacterium sp. J-030]MCJ2068518.1 ParA family protein [Methylobacterium sp. J-030]
MHVGVVASQKGGAGKTSLMRSLAVATHQAGHATALLYTDPQGSLTSWWNRREDAQPALVWIEVVDFAAGAER